MLSTVEAQMPLPEVILPSKSAVDIFNEREHSSTDMWKGWGHIDLAFPISST